MIKSFVEYIKKKQKLYFGLIAINNLESKAERLIAALLFGSGLDFKEMIDLKWKNLTIIKNILLINKEKDTRIAIAPQFFTEELLKSKDCEGKIFKENISIKRLNNALLLNSINFELDVAIDSSWLKNNFIKTIYVPQGSRELFKKHILNREPIKNMPEKDFKKILEIQSFI